MTDISQKMLSATLKNLERDNLIKRKAYPEVPPRVEYSLTHTGESLMPHIEALIGGARLPFRKSRRLSCLRSDETPGKTFISKPLKALP